MERVLDEWLIRYNKVCRVLFLCSGKWLSPHSNTLKWTLVSIKCYTLISSTDLSYIYNHLYSCDSQHTSSSSERKAYYTLALTWQSILKKEGSQKGKGIEVHIYEKCIGAGDAELTWKVESNANKGKKRLAFSKAPEGNTNEIGLWMHRPMAWTTNDSIACNGAFPVFV